MAALAYRGAFLKSLQQEHRLWVDREFPGQPPCIPAAGMVEEAGELLHAVLKLEQHRIWGADPRYSLAKLQADLVDAIGDCAIYVCSFCNATNRNFGEMAMSCSGTLRGDLLPMAVTLCSIAAKCNRSDEVQTPLWDYISCLMSISHVAGFDFEEAVMATWDTVQKRTRLKASKPKVVCLCGSTRFYEHFQRANYERTMAGEIVLSIGFAGRLERKQVMVNGCMGPQETEVLVVRAGQDVGCTPKQKTALDELHKRKIDLADEVFVLNVNGYIGDSTRSEIEYARKHGKPVKFLEESLEYCI